MNGSEQTEHVAWQEILDALESPSGLPPEVEAHCERCDECRDLVQAGVTLLRVFARARLPRVPESLAAATLDRVLGPASPHPVPELPAWSRMLAGLAAGLDELVARLVGDSLTPSAVVRGAATAAVRTLLYETDDYSISLALEREQQGAAGILRGQVVPLGDEALPERRRAILHRRDALTETELDELGGFHFESVPDEELRLAIVVGSSYVQVAPLPPTETNGESVS